MTGANDVYMNEWDSHGAKWLQNLYPDAVVDGRSITDVAPADVPGFRRVHFFAGIGGWEYALHLAGWPADRPIWTGSCPCQPFSTAGKGWGKTDKRHLWPEMFRLIRECRPDTAVGEQVATAITHDWLDGVFADLEAEGYTCGAVVLGAHSVGAPHIRQRIFWVAHLNSGRQQRGVREHGGTSEVVPPPRCGVGESVVTGLEGHGSGQAAQRERDRAGRAAGPVGPASVPGTHWDGSDHVVCRDGKVRRIEPGLQPVVDGVPFLLADGRTRAGVSRAKTLHGIGNAIVPQVAAAFLRAILETT